MPTFLFLLSLFLLFIANMFLGVDNYEEEKYGSACFSFFVSGFLVGAMIHVFMFWITFIAQ